MKASPFKSLKEDHKRVAKLFKEIEAAGERAVKTKQNLFEELRTELTQHMELEETEVYPVLEEHEKTKEIALEGVEEHAVAKRLIEEIGAEEAGSEVWEAKIKVLKENIEHHVDEEEEEMFPDAEKALPEEVLEALAAAIEAAKADTADKNKRSA